MYESPLEGTKHLADCEVNLAVGGAKHSLRDVGYLPETPCRQQS